MSNSGINLEELKKLFENICETNDPLDLPYLSEELWRLFNSSETKRQRLELVAKLAQALNHSHDASELKANIVVIKSEINLSTFQGSSLNKLLNEVLTFNETLHLSQKSRFG